MKKFLLPILLLFSVHSFSQSCGTETLRYVINNQQKADNFSKKFKDCPEFLGDIIISGEIENLNGLTALKKLKGTLQIWKTTNLKDIEGLNNLESISGDLLIGMNEQITNLNALSKLKEVGQKITINKNTKLQNVSGLKMLKNVGTSLMINLNPEIINLEGLNNLESIGGMLYVFENLSLKSLMTSNKLNKVGDKIAVLGNTSLTQLNGFNQINLASVNDINISRNTILSTCSNSFLCAYIAAGKVINLSLNAPGCNVISEIKTACK
jgi:hypothetical protein